MDENMDIESTSGPSRRDVLRRSAIVGGALVWTTPVVQSLAGPAFAQEVSPGTDDDCDEFFIFKYEVDEDRFDSGTAPDCEPENWNDPSNTPVPNTSGNTATIPGHGTVTVTISPDGQSATITIPPDCQLLSGQAKAGSSQGGTLVCGPVLPTAEDGIYTVSITREISFVAGRICC